MFVLSPLHHYEATMEQIAFGTDSFAENPEPRVPCVLILDVSQSMAGQAITELNDGLKAYKDELSADGLASKRVEVAVISFGNEVKTVCDFATADQFQPPTLEPSGMTPMGRAVNLAIDIVEAQARKRTRPMESHTTALGFSSSRTELQMTTDGKTRHKAARFYRRRKV